MEKKKNRYVSINVKTDIRLVIRMKESCVNSSRATRSWGVIHSCFESGEDCIVREEEERVQLEQLTIVIDFWQVIKGTV